MHLCDGCHAGCCRSFAVPVTGADILRIERDREIVFWDFVCRWADPEGKIARKYAPHFHFEDDPATPYVICLRHSESRYFPQTTKCLNLVETPPDDEHPLGTAHCGIYESRPAACRAFPTKLNETGELAVLYDVPAHGGRGTDELYSLCPRPWTTDDVDPLQVVPDLVVAKFEMQFFHQLAVAWNQHPKSWDLFPDFLRVVYSSRVMPAPRPDPADEEAHTPDVSGPQTIKFPETGEAA